MGSSSSKNNNTRGQNNNTRGQYNNTRRQYNNTRGQYNNTRRRQYNNNLELDESEETLEEYYRQIAAHELRETLKKSKKQKQSFLKNYHIIKLEDLDVLLNDECPICLEKLLIGDKVYLFPCCHYFHKDCITDWVFRDNVCPSCRDTIGKHTSDEIDIAILNRDIKNKRNKNEYYNKLSIQELKKIVLISNIKSNINDSKQSIINKLVNIDKFFNLKLNREYSDYSNESDESNTEYFDKSTDEFNDQSDDETTNDQSDDETTNDQSDDESTNDQSDNESTNDKLTDDTNDKLTDDSSSFDYDQSISPNNLRIINKNNIILDDDI